MLFPKSSRNTLFPPNLICSSSFLLCFLPLLSLISISWQCCRWLLLFLWAKSEQYFCLFYTWIQDFFEENDDEVDGRSSSVSFRLSQANCSANFFFNRYYFIRAASFFSNSSHFIGSKYRKCLRYFLFSCSDLFFCIFDLVLISFLFSIGLTVILVCFHHFSFDLTKIEDLIAGTLNSWNS